MSAGRCAWHKRQRLLRAPEFTAFHPPLAPWRAARQYLALSAIVVQPAAPPPQGDAIARDVPAGTRFGITVSRRQARRAVARNMVKRIVREAARHKAAGLDAALDGQRLDVLFRLKAPLPAPATAGWAQLMAQLRREADSLLDQLLDRARGGRIGVGAPPRPMPPRAGRKPDSLAQSAGGPATLAAPSAAATAVDANKAHVRNRA